MTNNYPHEVETARDYYNSEDADNFYFHIWGGEDIHIGLHASDAEPIRDASRRTVQKMAERIEGLGPNSSVLDLGSGYGGAARYLASAYGCSVTALNLSEVENERNRSLTAEQGLSERIEVVEGSFENVPFDDGSFDVVWSQDAILHAADRSKVVGEAARVLNPGGQLVFTDPMQADDCPPGVLQPILDRLHLDSLASPAYYTRLCKAAGLKNLGYEDHAEHLPRHYLRVLEELQRRRPEIAGMVSDDYIQRMSVGLRHWVDGGHAGHLAWGIFHFQK